MLEQPQPTRPNRYIKNILRFSLIVSLVVIITITAKYANTQELLRSGLVWINQLGFWGPLAFIVIYNLATVLFIPGSILTLGGGFIFGIIWGSLYVFIAATLGATFAFLIGRYLSRDWVAKQIEKHPKFKAIDEAVGREGFKIVFLTRLSPIFPFNLLNYAFGVTQVSLKDYILGSFGMIPGTMMYVYLGSLGGEIAIIQKACYAVNTQASTANLLINGLGFIATVAVTSYAARIARKSLEASI
ncbi:TVP38/TMEM64 family protein [Kamptonema sp. UHCC 0994]|uniref:TVP38/TMEM64 family protein n=1 Tax=Kamptonema sp. UHCC 0994 TaxID=3031329 RepID=UPI0023B8A022|nr:TVP38/TMEM64 family protein [Kamptonema sp. UHCC 0994]MDF0551853.1 TVP38/TMEM64 family protein [Kamptonema sp. UHCC 0994]